ncbi:MAG: DUF2971 domain-containing protein [Chitinophagales bacterium]
MTNKAFTTKDYKGREFQYKVSNGNPEIKHGLKTPDKFYKYYGDSEFKRDSILADIPKLYFSHSYQFNDCVDSSHLIWNMENLDFEFYKKLLKNCHLQVHLKSLFNTDLINDFIEYKTILSKNLYPFNYNKQPDLETWVHLTQEEIFQKIKSQKFAHLRIFLNDYEGSRLGIFCLTNSFANNLMWAHYTEERGFCVEFDTQKLLKDLKDKHDDGFTYFPINYQKKIKQIDFQNNCFLKAKDNKLDLNIPYMYLYSVKDKTWHYENEWRLMIENEKFGTPVHPIDSNYTETINHQERSIEIERDAINKIILGPYFFNTSVFSNIQYHNQKTFTGYFKNNCDACNVMKALMSMKSNYNDMLYQIERVVCDEQTIERKIAFKIEILDIDEKKVEIKRIEILK